MLHDKTIFLGFWETDQQPYTVIKLGHLLLYVEQQILQMIQSITKQALLSIAMLFDSSFWVWYPAACGAHG